MNSRLIMYYAATVLFIVLDVAIDINLRVSFLDQQSAARVAYYLICFVCLGLMLWRPALAPVIAGFESLISLVALLLTVGIRVILPMAEDGGGAMRLEEIANFLIVGFISYFVWVKGMRELFDKSR